MNHQLRIAAAATVLLVAAACTDQPFAPVPPPIGDPAAARQQVDCTVDVRAATMSCVGATPTGPVSLNRIVGGQESYIRLATSSSSYDAGLERFAAQVTVQNLLQQAMGTPDGSTVEGVRVFFYTGPIATSGSGSVTVANADGTDLFLSGSSPYFEYAQILAPYQISAERRWEFDVPATVSTFRFSVYVETPLADPDAPLVDRVWTGTEGSAWEDGANWKDGETPEAESTVAIPADSLLSGGAHPVLSGDATVANLRVGAGSSLSLGGHTLTATGIVDAPGTISGGTVQLTGAAALIGGSLPALRIAGSARLQRPVAATGPVTVADGTLTVTGHTLTVQLP